ncbi:UDP-N-acetylmuramoyl-L-alanyl-D-glutamate--2,6-diaminopimelate ligase [Patescibacteria group bacterium]|nr:UDP-N-acetylmuramoyl-L-alanyl-D-glutamate--2,6-diaminopimelate ligase [Patescibacteria group bacterium]
MSWLVALFYGLPARHLVVIGVTGTKGKSTVSNMIWYALQNMGYKTGLISTAQMAIGSTAWPNDLKMTMPGRLKLQQLLRQMVKEDCRYLVMETSSEGLAQFRQAGLPYVVGVFTNLTPEHIEAHGSFDNYKSAKGRLFAYLSKIKKPLVSPLGLVKPASVINLDDKSADYFLSFPVAERYGYSFNNKTSSLATNNQIAKFEEVGLDKLKINIDSIDYEFLVGGQFNAYNILAAALVGQVLNFPLPKVLNVLTTYSGTPGRLEFINEGQDFKVVVDYAHTVESLEQIYKLLGGFSELVAVLGSCGGGRDKARREPLGKLAGQYAKVVLVTNEDPYDEEPVSIMKQVAVGVLDVGKKEGVDLFIEPDRRQAIKKALQIAKAGEIVVITGKGSEQWLCVANNKKIPWDDRQVVREEIRKILNPKS